MAQKPKRPKNYVRDYSIICSIGFLTGLILIYYEVRYLPVVFTVGFVSIAPLFWFHEYHEALRNYQKEQKEELTNKNPSSKNKNINANIEVYLAQQNARKANKKWWQFWI